MRAACVSVGALILSAVRPALALSPEGRDVGMQSGAAPSSTSAVQKRLPTAGERDAARALSTHGFELFQQGNYAKALIAFRKAEDIIHTPMHVLYIARCDAKLGKLLEARQLYEDVVGEKLTSSAPAPFKEAQTKARAELEDLERQIPSLSISVTGAPVSSSLRVTLNDSPIAPEILGQPVPVDPGSYAIVVSSPGKKTASRALQILEGKGIQSVSINLEPEEEAPPEKSRTPEVFAFTLGGLGIVAGAVSLGFALTQPDGSQSTATALKVISAIHFVGGGVGVGAGVLLAVKRKARPQPAPPQQAPAAEPSVSVVIGPSSIAIAGVF